MKIVSIKRPVDRSEQTWIYTVEITEFRHVDVKLDEKDQTVSILQFPNGAEVYDPRNRTPITRCAYNREDAVKYAVNAYLQRDKLQQVTETVKEKIDRLGFYGFLYGPCCKKGIVCSCGKLSPPGSTLRQCRYCLGIKETEETL